MVYTIPLCPLFATKFISSNEFPSVSSYFYLFSCFYSTSPLLAAAGKSGEITVFDQVCIYASVYIYYFLVLLIHFGLYDFDFSFILSGG